MTTLTILPPQSLNLRDLRRDGGTQPRAALDQATVAEYAEAMQAGATFPPVVAFFDGEVYWLADGFHRVAALESLETLNSIQTIVYQGDQRAAVLYSTGVNAEHGLRRTNADKRRAVERLLRDPEWSQWSDSEIARQCKVDRRLVAEMRLSCTNVQDSPRTVIRGGTRYVMATGNIGSTAQDVTLVTDPNKLQDLVRSWLGTRVSHNHTAARNVLNQVSLGNHVGVNYLNAFNDWLRRIHLSAMTADVKRAMAAVQAELASASDDTYLPIWQLEQAVRKYLTSFPQSTDESRLTLLRDMIANDKPGAAYYAAELRRKITATYRESDLRQALNNVREQLSQAAARQAAVPTPEPVAAPDPEPAPPALRSAEDVAREAALLEPKIYRWLKLPAEPSRVEASQALRLVNSCLDLEGWHARRGRNFDWEALIGALGNDVDHDAVRQALRYWRTSLSNRLRDHDAPYAELITAATKALGVLKANAGTAPDEIDAIRALETALANLQPPEA